MVLWRTLHDASRMCGFRAAVVLCCVQTSAVEKLALHVEGRIAPDTLAACQWHCQCDYYHRGMWLPITSGGGMT
jgi:hypothetical protein